MAGMPAHESTKQEHWTLMRRRGLESQLNDHSGHLPCASAPRVGGLERRKAAISKLSSSARDRRPFRRQGKGNSGNQVSWRNLRLWLAGGAITAPLCLPSCTINGALENSHFVPIRNLEFIEHKAVEANSNNFVPIKILHFRRLVPLRFLVPFSALKFSPECVE
jgi:hypothetical protein